MSIGGFSLVLTLSPVNAKSILGYFAMTSLHLNALHKIGRAKASYHRLNQKRTFECFTSPQEKGLDGILRNDQRLESQLCCCEGPSADIEMLSMLSTEAFHVIRSPTVR